MIRRPAARIGVLRRPAARVRRPAAEEEEEEAEPEERPAAQVEEEVQRKFQEGQLVEAHKLHPGALGRGDWVVAEEAIYYQQKPPLAGRVVKEELEAGESEVTLELTGTQNETLLRLATSSEPCLLRLHLPTRMWSRRRAQTRRSRKALHLQGAEKERKRKRRTKRQREEREKRSLPR